MVIKLISLKKNLSQRFLIGLLDLETQLYQLLEALCMLIKPTEEKLIDFSLIRPPRLGNAALSTSRSPMYVNKADFTEEKLILTIFP